MLESYDAFCEYWNKQEDAYRSHMMYEVPYQGMTVLGMPVTRPSLEEFQRLVAEAAPRGIKRPAEEIEGDADSSSRVRMNSPLRKEEQYSDLLMIPHLDGA